MRSGTNGATAKRREIPNGATAKQRQIPNGAKFRTARNPRHREIPNGAKSRTPTNSAYCQPALRDLSVGLRSLLARAFYRCLGFRAVRDFAPFGISRRSRLRPFAFPQNPSKTCHQRPPSGEKTSSCQRLGSDAGAYTNPHESIMPHDVVMNLTCPSRTSPRCTKNSPTRPGSMRTGGGDRRRRCASRVSAGSLRLNRARNSGRLPHDGVPPLQVLYDSRTRQEWLVDARHHCCIEVLLARTVREIRRSHV